MNAVSANRVDTQPSRIGTLLRTLIAAPHDVGALVLRTVLGAVMIPHGAQHALGWFGGYGFAASRDWMASITGVPASLAAVAVIGELTMPFFLLAGLGGRAAAFFVGGLLAVAAMTHSQFGFFMNWVGAKQGEGFEYHLLGIAIAAALVLRGSGAWSVDRLLSARHPSSPR
jgi:putative oxidoreductase